MDDLDSRLVLNIEPGEDFRAAVVAVFQAVEGLREERDEANVSRHHFHLQRVQRSDVETLRQYAENFKLISSRAGLAGDTAVIARQLVTQHEIIHQQYERAEEYHASMRVSEHRQRQLEDNLALAAANFITQLQLPGLLPDGVIDNILRLGSQRTSSVSENSHQPASLPSQPDEKLYDAIAELRNAWEAYYDAHEEMWQVELASNPIDSREGNGNHKAREVSDSFMFRFARELEPLVRRIAAASQDFLAKQEACHERYGPDFDPCAHMPEGETIQSVNGLMRPSYAWQNSVEDDNQVHFANDADRLLQAIHATIQSQPGYTSRRSYLRLQEWLCGISLERPLQATTAQVPPFRTDQPIATRRRYSTSDIHKILTDPGNERGGGSVHCGLWS